MEALKNIAQNGALQYLQRSGNKPGWKDNKNPDVWKKHDDDFNDRELLKKRF